MASAFPGIPGLDVTELDDLGNPKNPSLRTGASPQAQAWQASRAVPPTAAVPPVPEGGLRGGIGDMARSAWGALSGKPQVGPPLPLNKAVPRVLGRVAGPAIGAGIEGSKVYDVAKDPGSTGLDVATQAAEGTSKLATAGLGAAGGAAVAGPVGALAGGIAGYYGGEKVIHGLRDYFGLNPDSPAEQAQARARPPANSVSQAPAPAAGAPQAPAPTNITRTGNSYTGPANIAGPITINGMKPGSGLRGDPSPQNQAAAQALSDKYGGAPAPMVANADGTGGMVGINGTPFAGGAEHAAQFRQQVSRSNLEGALRDGMRNPRTAAAAMQAAAGLQGEDNGLAIASMKEQGETLRSGAANNVAMQTAKLRAGVETRGQDMGLEGHKYTADQTLRGSIARTNYDIKKDQRDNEQKLENQQYERTAGATKRLQSEFESTLPQVEGKPDTARAALYANGLPAFVASHKQQLEKAVAANPGSATLRAQLDTLNTKGADAITTSPTGLAQFLAGMQLAELASGTATSGLTLWGTRAVASNEPITSIRADGHGNYVTNRRGVNGETEVIPARYIETEGGVMGTSFGGKASNKFAALIEK